MDGYFYHYFKPVSAIHIVTVFALMFISSIKSCRVPKRETYIPIQFMMEETPKMEVKPLLQEQIQPPQDKPNPPSKSSITYSSPTPPSKPKKVSSVQPQSLPIKRLITSAKRNPPQPQRTKTPKSLSAQEIEKILSSSLASNTSTVIADDEARCLELIRKTLYDAWGQPCAEESRGLDAIIGLTFDSRGHITQWRFIKKSGNTIFDETVTRALNSVSMIPGLSPSFIAVKREITILFRVEETE